MTDAVKREGTTWENNLDMCGCGDCLGRDNPFDASDTNKENKKLEDDYREKQRVQQKLREEYSVKVQNKQAKIAALQSQINPHFCTTRWNVYEVRRFYMNVTALPVWRRHWRLFPV